MEGHFMRFLDKIAIDFYRSRKRALRSKLRKIQNDFDNQETFHNLVEMDPRSYELKKSKMLKQLDFYKQKLSDYSKKIKEIRKY